MAIQWTAPLVSLSQALWLGELINESAAGGIQWTTPGGTLVNEQSGGPPPPTPGTAHQGSSLTIGIGIGIPM